MEDRSANGRFAVGNRCGPGRPRRLVERDYLGAMSEAVPLESWQRIVAKAVADAEAGDDKARSWLSKHLLGTGDSPNPLLRIAINEAAGHTVEHEITGHLKNRAADRELGESLAAILVELKGS